MLGLALTTGGCSMFTGPRPERTPVPLSRQPLTVIKVEVKAIEADLASFVPAETVQAVEPSSRGSILTCSNGGASWASHTTVRVSEAPDFVDMADRVRSEWARAGEFTIDMGGTTGDDSGFVLTGYGAQNYFVGMLGDVLQIDSFGPCFELVPERDGYPWDISAE
jgi:hypothetical protein